MRQQILLCLATLGLSMQVYGAKPVSDIEGLRVRERFRYGVHHLRWDQDVNGNQIMEFGEVSTSADAGKTWNLLEDEGVFKSTVGSRRQTREDPQPGVVFKSVPGRDLSLHIHYPEDWNASDRRSVILWFHGGGFAGGNPVQFQKFCEHFAELGIVNIRVAYRLRVLDNANGGGFDAAKDGRSAIRWVRQHAAELGIAPNRVIAGGDSAGGALALATCRNDLDDPDDDLSISAVPNAILGESAWVLLHKPGIEDRSLVWPLLTLQELPPIWLGYGGEDIGYKASSPLGGEAFVAALKAKGADLSVHIIPEGKHGYGFRPHFFPRCLESMEQFLIKHEFLPLAAQTSNTRVIVDDDFEQGVVKSVTVTHSGEKSGYRLHAPTPRLRCMFPATDPEDRAGVEVTTVRAAAGKQSLKLINASTKQLAHHAGLIWWLDRLKEDVRSGVLNISFDILIPEKNGNDLSLMTRDYSLHPPAHMIGMNVSKENVAFGGRKAAVTPGTWVHCEMALPMGVAEGTAVVKVVDTKLGSRVLEQPLDKVQQVNWIYFMMAGKQDAHLFLDNLKIVVKNELPVAEPVEEMLNITRKEDTAWQATPSVMLDLFPESVASVPEASQGKTRMSATYKASGSLWGEGLNEEWVFHREIRHVQDKDNSYALRIGKGGQLYSLRGPFGETVPPSSLGTPWNDEVWPFVA
ncbi:MAG: alpha/beta hydrolase, partial [Verrucomicrobia bacterium]|nr:alpha/beta hydrolase [Verrucomicrobiota bacterium]